MSDAPDEASGSDHGSVAERLTLERAFAAFDTDGSGLLDLGELKGLTLALGVKMSDGELRRAMKALDEDKSGLVDKDEFIAWWQKRKTSTAQTDDYALQSKLDALVSAARKLHRVDVHTAAWSGDLDALRQLLERDPQRARAEDTSDYGDGYTPLHYAAYQGHLEVVRMLVRRACRCRPSSIALRRDYLSPRAPSSSSRFP